MTCHHSDGDPNCSSTRSSWEAEQRQRKAAENAAQRELEYARTPDKTKYEIAQFERVSSHIVMKVLYPNCKLCSYEGNKVLVFLNVPEDQMVHWREIDPHFRDPKNQPAKHQAPTPAARFPANAEGWRDAIEYAQSKVRRQLGG